MVVRDEEHANAVTQAREQIATILELDAEKQLIRSRELGQRSGFAPVADYIAEIRSLLHDIDEAGLEDLSTEVLRADVVGQATNAVRHFEKLERFDPHQQSAEETRNELINETKQLHGAVWRALTPWLDHLRSGGTEAGSGLEEIRQIRQAAESTMGAFQDEQERATQEMRRAVDVVKSQAAEAGIADQADVFADRAKEHKDSARSWLIATVGLSIATVVWAVVAFSSSVSLSPTTPRPSCVQ